MSDALGMNPVDLVLSLAAELETPTQEFLLANGQQARRNTVQIHCGVMPTKRPDQSEWPFLYVYLMEGEDGGDLSFTTCAILVGTYSQEDAGWRDALNLAMCVRTHLLRHRLLAGKYRLLLDDKHKLKYSTFEQLTSEARTYPFNYVLLQASWRTASIAPEEPDFWQETVR
jgi:hypothetical protein